MESSMTVYEYVLRARQQELLREAEIQRRSRQFVASSRRRSRRFGR
jgi:hypothetical protein